MMVLTSSFVCLIAIAAEHNFDVPVWRAWRSSPRKNSVQMAVCQPLAWFLVRQIEL